MSPTNYPLAVLSAAACLLGGAAHAGDSNAQFDAFVQVCATPAADIAAVKAAAAAKGWGASDVAVDSSMAGVDVTDRLSKSLTSDKVGLVLSAWAGTKGAIRISDCAIHIQKAEFSDVRSAAGAWLAIDPQAADAKKATWRFTGAAGAHKALTPADFDAAAAAAGLEILTVSGDESGTVLDLMVIRK